jgi:hypothetical protein
VAVVVAVVQMLLLVAAVVVEFALLDIQTHFQLQ